VSATLRLVRDGFGMELWRGKYDISVDGQRIGAIELHDTVETPLDPGHHTLRVERGRYTSPTRSFDLSDGESVNFRCHGANIWPRWVASFVKPDLAIALRRE
jgi:hypothetical protein